MAKQQRPEDHEAHNPNIDPPVTGDADLEPGGGVKPGHTPPESQSATSTPPHPPATRPPRSKATIVLVSVFALVFVFLFVAYAMGLWD